MYCALLTKCNGNGNAIVKSNAIFSGNVNPICGTSDCGIMHCARPTENARTPVNAWFCYVYTFSSVFPRLYRIVSPNIATICVVLLMMMGGRRFRCRWAKIQTLCGIKNKRRIVHANRIGKVRVSIWFYVVWLMVTRPFKYWIIKCISHTAVCATEIDFLMHMCVVAVVVIPLKEHRCHTESFCSCIFNSNNYVFYLHRKINISIFYAVLI